MNLSEFKAWFEGFTENLNGAPNKAQWERICAKVERITSDPTPWPVIIDRYVRPYSRYWDQPMWTYYQSSAGATSARDWTTSPANAANLFRNAGRAEFTSMQCRA